MTLRHDHELDFLGTQPMPRHTPILALRMVILMVLMAQRHEVLRNVRIRRPVAEHATGTLRVAEVAARHDVMHLGSRVPAHAAVLRTH